MFDILLYDIMYSTIYNTVVNGTLHVWKAFRDVTVFVCSGGNTTERKREEAILHFIPLQYIMLTRGILWATATIIATLCPLSLSPSLCFSSSLYPSHRTACFLPPFTDSCVCLRVCCCICSLSAQHVSPVWVCAMGFMHIYILDVWFLCASW